jgi:hypothetical protein
VHADRRSGKWVIGGAAALLERSPGDAGRGGGAAAHRVAHARRSRLRHHRRPRQHVSPRHASAMQPVASVWPGRVLGGPRRPSCAHPARHVRPRVAAANSCTGLAVMRRLSRSLAGRMDPARACSAARRGDAALATHLACLPPLACPGYGGSRRRACRAPCACLAPSQRAVRVPDSCPALRICRGPVPAGGCGR